MLLKFSIFEILLNLMFLNFIKTFNWLKTIFKNVLNAIENDAL